MSYHSRFQGLFSSQVNRIMKPSQWFQESKNNLEVLSTQDQNTDIIYQPVKLIKRTVQRQRDGQSIKGLVKTQGLRLFPPDTQYRGLLRHLKYNPDTSGLNCQILMLVAMQNEHEEEFTNTMEGIADNLKTFSKYGVPPNKIACCVIVDGVKAFFDMFHQIRVHKKYFGQFLNEQEIKRRVGVDDVLKCQLLNEEPQDQFAHVFMSIAEFEGFLYPVQILFVIKQKQLGKLNTHLWFFGGFCEHIQPKYVILLDAGIKPLHKSLFYMYQAMKTDEKVAGCCGQLKPKKSHSFNCIIQAQLVQYKFSHIFDKAFQSVFGNITILPGAFSAYQWEALQGDPLWKYYFKPFCHPQEMNCFQSNIYLAQERVLCFALVSKADQKYRLKYIKNSIAQTHVQETISGFLVQKSRWINGSWFALIDAVRKFKLYQQSNHNCCRIIFFTIQMIYYWINLFFSWFIVGIFFLVIALGVREFMFVQGCYGNNENQIQFLIQCHVTLLIIAFVLSVTVRAKRVQLFLYSLCGVFSFGMLYIIIIILTSWIDENDFSKWAVIAVRAEILMFIVTIIVNDCIIDIWKGLVQMIILIPAYVNLLYVYSICNTHDCIRGYNTGQKTWQEKRKKQDFKVFRAKWCLFWILCNLIFVLIFNSSQPGYFFWFFDNLAIIGGFLLGVRILFGLIYIFQETSKKGLKKVNERLLFEVEIKKVQDQLGRYSSSLPWYQENLGYQVENNPIEAGIIDSFQNGCYCSKPDERPDYLEHIDNALQYMKMTYNEIAELLQVDIERVIQIHHREVEPE